MKIRTLSELFTSIQLNCRRATVFENCLLLCNFALKKRKQDETWIVFFWQSMLLMQSISPTGTDCEFAACGIRVRCLRKNSDLLAMK